MKFKIILVGLFMVLASVFSTGPASAHYVSIYQGKDNAWVTYDHDKAAVDDNECDGHGVIVNVRYGTNGFDLKRDTDGCGSGIYYVNPPSPITQIQICELDNNNIPVACSAWYRT